MIKYLLLFLFLYFLYQIFKNVLTISKKNNDSNVIDAEYEEIE